ncbi:MAG TPA: hypothetical protein PLA94_33020, partial [Myxococcota bacterium]|nr:hypothetical protein [Myxococcota bacterium]
MADPPLRLKPSAALGGQSCATALRIPGDAEHPFRLCTQHPRASLHHVVGEKLITLVEAWDSTRVPLQAAVWEGAGCAPCLATGMGLLWREREVWSVLALPAELRQAATAGRGPEEGWRAPRLQLAVEQGRLVVRGGGHALAREGSQWVPVPPPTGGATQVTGRPVGETVVYRLSELELVVGGPGGVAWRPWSALWPEGEVGHVRVVGVEPGDVLQVRAGPSTGAAPRGQLSSRARCVATVVAPKVSGWQAVE